MDKENKYYSIIEQNIKENRKFKNFESLFDAIADDVYQNIKGIADSITEPDVLNSYIKKSVALSMINVPRRLNYKPDDTYLQEKNIIEEISIKNQQKISKKAARIEKANSISIQDDNIFEELDGDFIDSSNGYETEESEENILGEVTDFDYAGIEDTDVSKIEVDNTLIDKMINLKESSYEDEFTADREKENSELQSDIFDDNTIDYSQFSEDDDGISFNNILTDEYSEEESEPIVQNDFTEEHSENADSSLNTDFNDEIVSQTELYSYEEENNSSDLSFENLEFSENVSDYASDISIDSNEIKQDDSEEDSEILDLGIDDLQEQINETANPDTVQAVADELPAEFAEINYASEVPSTGISEMIEDAVLNEEPEVSEEASVPDPISVDIKDELAFSENLLDIFDDDLSSLDSDENTLENKSESSALDEFVQNSETLNLQNNNNLVLSDNLSSDDQLISLLDEDESEEIIISEKQEELQVSEPKEQFVFGYAKKDFGDICENQHIAEKILSLNSQYPNSKIAEIYKLKYEDNLKISEIAEKLGLTNDDVIDSLSKMVEII